MTPFRPANRYLILRHGHSQGNERGLVVSDPQRGREAFGLTECGRDQVRVTAATARDQGRLDPDTRVIASPFLRAVETARIVIDLLEISDFAQDDRLCERYCGSLEMGTDHAYPKVWEQDRRNPDHTQWGVESVSAMAVRLAALLRDLEGRYRHQRILLVAHGDVASTLLCWARGEDLRRHREVGTLATAELAEVVFSSAFPEPS